MVRLVAQMEIDDAVEGSCGGHGQKNGQDYLNEMINWLNQKSDSDENASWSAYNCLHLDSRRRRLHWISTEDAVNPMVSGSHFYR